MMMLIVLEVKVSKFSEITQSPWGYFLAKVGWWGGD